MYTATQMRPRQRPLFSAARQAKCQINRTHMHQAASASLNHEVAMPPELTWQHALKQAHVRYWQQDW